MNRKQLTLIIVVAVVVAGLGFYAYKARNDSWEDSSQKLGQKVIKSFPINDVERIAIKQSQGQLDLAKKNDLWTVQERGDYPANFETVSEFLRKVWDLKVAQSVDVGSSKLARLELTPPDKSTNSGTLVEFKDKSGKTLNSLLLGKKHMRESHNDSGFGGGGWPDGRYLMVGNDAQTVAIVSEPFSNVEAKPEEWLNKDFFKVEKLKSIAITGTNATNNWKLSRESETNEWKLADVKAGEQLDTGKISWVNNAFSSPSFSDVATNSAPEQTGLSKPLLANVETVDGFKYEIKAGNKISPEKDDYYVQMSVSGTFPKERAAGKDEKPEDKTKLDKEFQEKIKKLEEKLKAEKAYEKWTYVVSKWTIDPLFKERKDLLVEKKEEPKPADTKGEEPKKTTQKTDDAKPAVKTAKLPPPTPPIPLKPEAKPDSTAADK
jgi:hypothetical protein